MLDRRDWNKGVQPGTFSLVGQGVTLVGVTGTAVPLRASTSAAVIFIRARRANVGLVRFGASGVTNDEAAATGGVQLSPGDYAVVSETDVAHVFITGTAGDGVSYAWWT